MMPCINTNHAHDDRVHHIMSYSTVADLACIQQPVHVYHILVNFVIDVVLESNLQMISGRIRAAQFAANSEYG